MGLNDFVLLGVTYLFLNIPSVLIYKKEPRKIILYIQKYKLVAMPSGDL